MTYDRTSQPEHDADSAARRTKRRYAHELYPHAEEWQTRPLAVEVPYLYARAVGLQTYGTGWMSLIDLRTPEGYRESGDRSEAYVMSGLLALMADALLQGMTGDEAWKWANDRAAGDNIGEWIWERAVHHGVDPNRIKPYPCGPEPEHHTHESEPDARGWRRCTRVYCPESDCPDCTEPAA